MRTSIITNRGKESRHSENVLDKNTCYLYSSSRTTVVWDDGEYSFSNYWLCAQPAIFSFDRATWGFPEATSCRRCLESLGSIFTHVSVKFGGVAELNTRKDSTFTQNLSSSIIPRAFRTALLLESRSAAGLPVERTVSSRRHYRPMAKYIT